MFRVRYNDNQRGTLECPRCGKALKLPGNAHTFKDSNGVTRTYPDARNSIYSHFNHDKNSFIEVCGVTRMEPGTTPWEAIDERGDIVARGRVVISQIGNAIQGPSVEQDEPQ